MGPVLRKWLVFGLRIEKIKLYVTVFFLLFPFLFCSLTGCSLFRVKKDSEFVRNASILIGKVSSKCGDKTPVVVVAYSKKGNERKVAHFTCLHEPGFFELMVPKGEYHVFAFEDKNENMIYDKDEPAGQFGNPDTIFAPAGGVVSNLDFPISGGEGTTWVDFPAGTAIAERTAGKMHSTLAGAIADLDDPVFSRENGSRGYWAGVDFFREIGGNIYFLERYDPAKIPVLFVHGAKGSPQDWRYFFENIDRTRYQPWFFYYPSGASLKTMANLLNHKLWDLQLRYRFKRLYITGHSMGSLIVRSLLVDSGKYYPFVKLFVSISSPWGGVRSAEFGVKHSPAVLPSWQDMQPEGEFIKSLFRAKLPSDVGYYLLFGFKNGINPLLPNGDGVIAMSSMLDLRAQSEARFSYGFNEDHTSILTSPEVLKLYNSILSSADREFDEGLTRPGGKIKILFSFDTPDKGLKPPVILLQLSPASGKGDSKILTLLPSDSGMEFGPYAPGKYNVRIAATAFLAEPLQFDVCVKQGKIPTVKFTLKPQGVLYGYISGKLNPDTFVAGALSEKNTSVKSVALAGNGIKRILFPSKDKDSDALGFASGKDFFNDGWFSFQGLPEGTYTITITADGYVPYTASYNVSPGKYGVWQPIVLENCHPRYEESHRSQATN